MCALGGSAANSQQLALALASYQALPVGRVQTAGERRGAIGDQRSPIAPDRTFSNIGFSTEAPNRKPNVVDFFFFLDSVTVD